MLIDYMDYNYICILLMDDKITDIRYTTLMAWSY